jgi:hypothetical protein
VLAGCLVLAFAMDLRAARKLAGFLRRWLVRQSR